MREDKAARNMLLTSCVYMALGMTLGVIVAMKMLWPSLGEFELLSFGRIRMAHTNVVLFGWLLQADMGLLLYILPRLLHTKLFSERLGQVTWILFNIAALGGVGSIMMGINKGIEYAEIPAPFDYLVAVTWVLFGINVFGTIFQRKAKYFYVSVWYLVGSVIWTTFVYITGNFLTQLPGVTGINQANLTWFYVHNAVGLIFTPLGVSIAYYLIPKELDTPLYSHKLSLVGFWVISFVYVWTGAHHMLHGPISYWLQTVAILFSFSLIIPVFAVVTNFFGTFGLADRKRRFQGPTAKFLYAGTVFYVLTCLQGPFQSIRSVNLVVSKTDWVVGHAHMAVLGAFSFFAIAGLYHVLPRILGRELYSPRLGDLHFWLTMLGGIPFFAILWIGGVVQGLSWLNLDISFVEGLRIMWPYQLMRWLTGSLILGAQALLLFNIWVTWFGPGESTAATPVMTSDNPPLGVSAQ